jgi:serine/threonine-protein kinase
MALPPGTRLGPFEITTLLGAGGMGEVYRARDAKLNRDVAIKVLPDPFAQDPERLARFKREAQVLASLNHPNIAAIYGLEEGGGVQALVLELVEGPTLADRLAAGALPIEEALSIARQLCEALEAAHESGIVHRDLKPANIKIAVRGAQHPPAEDRRLERRPSTAEIADGTVKVLDFGLAKAFDVEPGGAEASRLPTLTSPAVTHAGIVMGTAAYMSPEQARGKTVDKRTDVWAFGCVLFEMLTGTRAFAGDDVTETLAAILRGEPEWTALPAGTPPAIVRLVRRSLAKDRRERLPDIAAARLEIQDALAAPAPSVPAARGRSRWVIPAAVAAGIVLGATAIELWRQQRPGPSPAAISAPLLRTTIELPEDALLALGTRIPEVGFDSPALAVSSDGRRLAYVGQSPSGTMLYLRDMSSFNVEAVGGTDGAIYAFFSPDGRWLGFLTNDKVKKVALDGGAPVTLADAAQPVSATWIGDDIFFVQDQGSRLSRVPARGGGATLVRTIVRGRFSQVLPDGKSALATQQTGGTSTDYADVLLLPLPSGDGRVLIHSGYDARYVSPGRLLFGRAASLYAVAFDAAKQEVRGDAVQVVAGASMESLFGQVHAAAANDGLIAYVPGGERALGRLAWVDRQGHTEYLTAPSRVYGVVDLSPDGTRLAAHVTDVTDYIWMYDFTRGEGRRLPLEEHSGWPVWSPDSRTLAFAAWRPSNQRRVVSRSPDGGGILREFLSVSGNEIVIPYSWSPDGRALALSGGGGGFFDISGNPKRVRDSLGGMPHFSPDGRWVAHQSNRAGRTDIFVTSYPDAKVSRQFSPDGGIEPVWCQCGELFYRQGNRWMSSVVRTEPELTWSPPVQAFQTDFIDTSGRSYDVSSDGKRMLVVKQAEPDVRSRIHIVANWTHQLESEER